MKIAHRIKHPIEKIRIWFLSFDRNYEDHINSQDHVFSEDEMLDESLMESFPASDSPGHRSKSAIDKLKHRQH